MAGSGKLKYLPSKSGEFSLSNFEYDLWDTYRRCEEAEELHELKMRILTRGDIWLQFRDEVSEHPIIVQCAAIALYRYVRFGMTELWPASEIEKPMCLLKIFAEQWADLEEDAQLKWLGCIDGIAESVVGTFQETNGTVLKQSESKKPSRHQQKSKPSNFSKAPILITTLLKHHLYENGSVLNWEPIGCNELARNADVAASIVSDFFKKWFESHSRYKISCQDQTVRIVLAQWAGESIIKTFGRDPDHRETTD